MSAVSPRRRGTGLLLAHTRGLLLTAEGSASADRPPASERLRAELGGELAERLVASLARAQREERRRGSSSP